MSSLLHISLSHSDFLFCPSLLPSVLLSSVFKKKKLIYKGSLHITGTRNLLILPYCKNLYSACHLLINFSGASLRWRRILNFNVRFIQICSMARHPVCSRSQPHDESWDSFVPSVLSYPHGHKRLGHRWAPGPPGPMIPLSKKVKLELSANQSLPGWLSNLGAVDDYFLLW